MAANQRVNKKSSDTEYVCFGILDLTGGNPKSTNGCVCLPGSLIVEILLVGVAVLCSHCRCHSGSRPVSQRIASGVIGNLAPPRIWHPHAKFPRDIGTPSGVLAPPMQQGLWHPHALFLGNMAPRASTDV